MLFVFFSEPTVLPSLPKSTNSEILNHHHAFSNFSPINRVGIRPSVQNSYVCSFQNFGTCKFTKNSMGQMGCITPSDTSLSIRAEKDIWTQCKIQKTSKYKTCSRLETPRSKIIQDNVKNSHMCKDKIC